MLRAGFVVLTLIAVVAPAPPLDAQVTDAPKDAKAKPKSTRRTRRSGPRFYMGRRIADVMSYEGADWLVRPERVQEEEPEKMLDALNIKAGSVVADVGAGVGYTSIRLAKRVGSEGLVLATDLQPQMLQMLAANAKEAGLPNIRPIRATANDTKLPEGKVDLVIMVDVYHECSEPEAVLQGLRKALKPGGRLVLVEFRAEDPEVPIKPEHKMTLRQARREVEPQGFTFRESIETLPWQHIIIFERPADAKGEPSKKKDN